MIAWYQPKAESSCCTGQPITACYFDHVITSFLHETEHVLSVTGIWYRKNSVPDCMTDATETGTIFPATSVVAARPGWCGHTFGCQWPSVLQHSVRPVSTDGRTDGRIWVPIVGLLKVIKNINIEIKNNFTVFHTTGHTNDATACYFLSAYH